MTKTHYRAVEHRLYTFHYGFCPTANPHVKLFSSVLSSYVFTMEEMIPNKQNCVKLMNAKRKFVQDTFHSIPSPKRQKFCKLKNNVSDRLGPWGFRIESYSPDYNSDDLQKHLLRNQDRMQGKERGSDCNVDTDFTRFVSSNQVDNTLSPLIWETLENRDYDSLMSQFGDDFKDDFISVTVDSQKISFVKNNCHCDNCEHSKTKNKIIEYNYGNSQSDIQGSNAENEREQSEVFQNAERYKNEKQKLCPSPILQIPDKFYVALDCEMVGVDVKGRRSALARCSIVDYQGIVIYDQYIKPSEPVTDYRTQWSGVTPHHMRHAVPENVALRDIYKCVENRIVIGHAVFNDFAALRKYPPIHMVRDTASCKLLVEMAGLEGHGRSLRKLAYSLLDKDIQNKKSGHDSVEDAITTLELFKLVRSNWEPELFRKWSKKGIDICESLSAMEKTEKNKHEDIDYLNDKFWPSDLLK